MKKKLLTLFTIIISISFLTENPTLSAKQNCNQEQDPFCLGKVDSSLKPIESDSLKLEGIVVEKLAYLLGFLGLIATIYGLYGAWNIFSALHDDDKVKKGKTIILRACIGLVVIFSAYPIVRFVIKDFLFGEETQTNYSKP